jgi:broad specificity phosphatase PhoE
MAELFLVRHGQASFGSTNYDQLSPMGWQQSRWLGQWFVQQGLSFDRIVTGTLVRHRETLQGILEGAQENAERPSIQLAGLNEYDSSVMLKARMGVVDEHNMAKDRRHYFRELRSALYDWTQGQLNPPNYQTYQQFRDGVVESVRQACESGAQRVLVVSSGGPISTFISHVLRTPYEVSVDINLQTRNSSYSQFAFNERSLNLMSFNNVPHLQEAGRESAITYS